MTEKRKKVAVITGNPCPKCGYDKYMMKLDLSNPEADEIPLISVCVVCRKETRLSLLVDPFSNSDAEHNRVEAGHDGEANLNYCDKDTNKGK